MSGKSHQAGGTQIHLTQFETQSDSSRIKEGYAAVGFKGKTQKKNMKKKKLNREFGKKRHT